MAGPDRDIIFFSYSRRDNRNPNFCEMLVRHFQALGPGRPGQLPPPFFVDVDIQPGARWPEEINRALRRTRVAVLLDGPGLMTSDFVQRVEVPAFLRAQQDGEGIQILRVPIRHVDPCLVPPGLLAVPPAWPLDQPLAGLSGAAREAALAEVVTRILAAYVA
jgi:hypothetical protein